jgi:hypothetical protein
VLQDSATGTHTGFLEESVYELQWMELLGHADIRITMNVNTQAMSEQKRQTHTKIVRLVLGA